MEFLASLAIKALIGTSICGTVTVGAVYGYDKTLLGFKDNDKNSSTNTQGGINNGRTLGSENIANDGKASPDMNKNVDVKDGDEVGAADKDTTQDGTKKLAKGDESNGNASETTGIDDNVVNNEAREGENTKTKNDVGGKDTSLSMQDKKGTDETVNKTITEDSVPEIKEELKTSENNADDTDPTSTIESNSGTQSEPKTSTKPTITTLNNGEGSVAGTDGTNIKPQAIT